MNKWTSTKLGALIYLQHPNGRQVGPFQDQIEAEGVGQMLSAIAHLKASATRGERKLSCMVVLDLDEADIEVRLPMELPLGVTEGPPTSHGSWPPPEPHFYSHGEPIPNPQADRIDLRCFFCNALVSQGDPCYMTGDQQVYKMPDGCAIRDLLVPIPEPEEDQR